MSLCGWCRSPVNQPKTIWWLEAIKVKTNSKQCISSSSTPEAPVPHVFLSQAFFVWLLSESHHRGREAQNSRGWGRPAHLHVGCWAARSAVSLNHPLACGMEAASLCMPVVRAQPTHPQLFLSPPVAPSIFSLPLSPLLSLPFSPTSKNIWKYS